MPYNKSKACVRRYLRYMQDMNEQKTTLTWPAEDAVRFARRLREAMWAACHHPEFSYLHDLRDLYRIRPRAGWVEAEFIGPPARAVPRAPERLEGPEAINAPAVVGACIKFADRANEIHCPNAILTEGELLTVYEWGRGEVPEWRLISHSEAGVTMTRKRGIDKTFLWKPKEADDE